MDNENRIRVVVVGGGFAGLNFIKRIAKNKQFLVTLVDKNNYHFFPPLLYQVATAFIELSNISYPFRRMFQEKENIRFHMGCLQRIDTASQTVVTDTGDLPYDHLVLAMGAETNYFGMENVKQNAMPMKTINDALNLRNYLLMNMEKAVRIHDAAERQKHLTVVIAGGGPTGVEIAGMLAEMGQHIVRKEYPEFGDLRGRIILLDAAPVLLGPMSKKSQQEAAKVLSDLGVIIKLNAAVKDYREGKVYLSDNSVIESPVLIWASGVTGVSVDGLPAESVGRGRRLLVNEFNALTGTNNVFAIGDISLQKTDAAFPEGHPQLAQVAIQQGQKLAANLIRNAKGEAMQPFKYKDKGTMAIISKFKAVVDLPNLFVKGFIAWAMWLFIHLIPIAGFRNKLKLATNWFWSFITNDPTLRLIVRPQKEDEHKLEHQAPKTNLPPADAPGRVHAQGGSQ